MMVIIKILWNYFQTCKLNENINNLRHTRETKIDLRMRWKANIVSVSPRHGLCVNKHNKEVWANRGLFSHVVNII